MDHGDLSFEGVLASSLRQLKRHWVFFLGIGLASLLMHLPFTVLVSRIPRELDSLHAGMATFYGFYLFNALLSCLFYGAVLDFVYQANYGPQPDGRQVMARAVSRWPAMVWTLIVRRFSLFLGCLLLIVPGLMWGYRQMLCWVVTAVEGLSGAAALRRAEALMKADPAAYSVMMIQWLLCMLVTVATSWLIAYPLLKQPLLIRTGLQWGVGLVNWLIYGLAYFSMVRVYGYLRDKLDGTPEEPEVGFSPSFEL